jgi:hypothetical protein
MGSAHLRLDGRTFKPSPFINPGDTESISESLVGEPVAEYDDWHKKQAAGVRQTVATERERWS